MFSLILILASHFASAAPPVVYGDDNRIDTFENTNPIYTKIAATSAAKVERDHIRINGQIAELNGPVFGDQFRQCKDSRFYDQPSIASCSGTLVAPDIIATAGHCMITKSDCEKADWVFGYKVTSSKQRIVNVSVSDVYQCDSVIQRGNMAKGRDYALVKLKRTVSGVTPVTLMRDLPRIGTSIVMIGHPSGLPQKIADGAEVRKWEDQEFFTNTDSFQINSGSGIFNAQSGEMVGILVRGAVDYRGRENASCMEVNVLDNSKNDEAVSSVEQFRDFL